MKKETSRDEQDFWLKSLDASIRGGQSKLAAEQISAFLRDKKSLDRDFLATFASLCRRVGLHREIIRLLNPIVRPLHNTNFVKASPKEKLEYAAALNRMGARAEALRLLKGVDSTSYPKALLFEAFVYFSLWQSELAVRPLQAFISHPKVDAYDQLVGKLNLAAAYVAIEATSQAQEVLDILIPELKRGEHRLLLGNGLEIQAQVLIAGGNFAEARRILNEAQSRLSQAQGNAPFFVKKWHLIADWKEGLRPQDECRAQTAALQEVARKNTNFESIRQLDLVQAIACQDHDKLRHIYAGSPMPNYRNSIEAVLGKERLQSEANFEWKLAVGEQPYKIDLMSCRFNGNESDFGSGHLVHRLLKLLCQDFYIPNRASNMYCELHPDKFLNLTTSTATIAQLLHRLRRALEAAKAPLKIVVHDGFYSLQATAPLTILTPMSHFLQDAYAIRFQDYKESFLRSRADGQSFRSPELAKTLGISKSSVLRFLRDAEARGWVTKEGQGVATIYKWAA